MKGQPKAAIVTQGPSQEEILKNINPADFMNTMAWMSDDWLEADALLAELGFPTQKEDGRLYHMADRIRDALGPYISRVRAAKDEEE